MRSSTPFLKRIHPAPGCHCLSRRQPSAQQKAALSRPQCWYLDLGVLCLKNYEEKEILLLHTTLSQAFCYSGTDELKQWPFSWQNTIYWEDCIPWWITKRPSSCRTCKPRCVVLPLDSVQAVPVPTRPSKCHVRVWIYSMLKGLLWN